MTETIFQTSVSWAAV